MSDDLIKKQQKYRRKLAKYQQTLSDYSSLKDNDISLKKRAAKLCKARLKIIKYQLKLKRVETNITQFAVYTKLTSANDEQVYAPILTHHAITQAHHAITQAHHAIAQAYLYRPHKSKPCKSCPALRGKACLCAIKQEQRRQA
ncbi:hypothetical protein ACVBIL_14070 [Shewanella sp. 125m-7]